MTDKYERVTDMSIGQVVDAAYGGDQFYMEKHNEYHSVDFQDLDIFALDNCIKQGRLYRKNEAPWWEEHLGSIVMVRDSEDAIWTPVILQGYSEGETYPFYDKEKITWKYMHPLIQPEKDAIITEG